MRTKRVHWTFLTEGRKPHAERDRQRFGPDFIGISVVSGTLSGRCPRDLPVQGVWLQGRLGWRGPDGFCVSQGKLAEVCGTPAQEAAPRVCFGKSQS
jgi:hypothetical protein